MINKIPVSKNTSFTKALSIINKSKIKSLVIIKKNKTINLFLKKNTPNKIAKKIVNFKYELKKQFHDI